LSSITNIHAREVLDSRGNPTVEVDVTCDDGSRGRAIAPSGASTGRAEAQELRDRDPHRYDGKGVRRAVANVRQTIGPQLVGLDPADQAEIDRQLRLLDGTADRKALGANALVAVSLAVCHAAAATAGLPLYRHMARLWQQFLPGELSGTYSGQPLRLPLPMTNMISGGLHAGRNMDFQDFLIMPVGAPDFATGLEWMVRVYRRLGLLLAETGYRPQLVGDEGGYGPALSGHRQALEFIMRAMEAAGLEPGHEITIAVDVAASHWLDGPRDRHSNTAGTRITSREFIDELESVVNAFPVTSIEDGLGEEDWEGWQQLTARLGHRVQIIGDDLIATNPQRLEKVIQRHAANAVLVKVNQIGTLSEALQVMSLARTAGFRVVVSARSGETEDTTIADLAVGTGADQIKIGGITRGERLAKYNRLLRIEEELRTL
jgi:enolase